MHKIESQLLQIKISVINKLFFLCHAILRLLVVDVLSLFGHVIDMRSLDWVACVKKSRPLHVILYAWFPTDIQKVEHRDVDFMKVGFFSFWIYLWWVYYYTAFFLNLLIIYLSIEWSYDLTVIWQNEGYAYLIYTIVNCREVYIRI